MSTEENRTHSGNWSVMSETALAKNFPLHRACRDGDVAALTALLQQDATHRHLTLEDTYYGWTPTHWAAYFGKLECLKVLVESNGSMHAGMTTSRFTQTPAHIAAFAGHPHCLLWLLQTGLNVNTQDYLGETSLHKAARTGSMDCVTVLLSSKVQIGILNNNGQTAAQLANACGYSDLGNYLLQAEGKQGNGEPNGFISRSVPSHGLNGGVFPHSTEMGQVNGTQKADTPKNIVPSSNCINTNGSINGSSSTFTSSNGYYGFQPTNNPANESMNGHGNIAAKSHNQESEDCEMETDANPAETQNGKDNTMEPVLNNYMKSPQNGFCNGNILKAVSTHTNDSRQNGSSEVSNGHNAKINFVSANHLNHQTSFVHKTIPPMEQDITLNDGISKNYIPIAGCKRSREDVYVPEMKRMKTDDHTVGRTAQAAPQETVVVDGDHCRSNNVTHEGTLSHKTAPLEEPAPGPAHPPVALNAQARAREQQRWIWVV